MNSVRKILKTTNILKYHQVLFTKPEGKNANNLLRHFHVNIKNCAKIFTEIENKYAYSIIENNGYATKLGPLVDNGSLSEKQFNEFIQKNWSKSSPQQVLEFFPKLGVYCTEHNLCISNKIFDEYIDHLTDNIKYATDEQLSNVFYSIQKWPETDSIRTRNYIEVWVALDDECLKRMKDCQWSYDKSLSFVNLFYMINVTKSSDFALKCIQRLASKAKNLNRGQLVLTLFFIGVLRKSPIDMHNLEVQLEKTLSDFSIDEIAIMSMGFFKSKTPIRSMDLVSKIINEIIKHSKEINEISLAALMKVVRYSMKVSKDDIIYEVLNILQHESPRLSIMCNVHIALLGTSTLTLNRDCLNAIANRVSSDISKARLKDLERLLFTFGTFSFIPQAKVCFIENILTELKKPERDAEIQRYGRAFACCVSYLSLLGFYPIELMNRILNPEFLEQTYGKYIYSYGREILCIHNIAQIFYPDQLTYDINKKTAKLLAKKYTDYVPREDFPKQYNVTERMMLDVITLLREERGGNDYVVGDHLLTHHQRGDIILCNDEKGSPLPIADKFKSANFGSIQLAPKDGNFWIVLIIVGRNSIIKKCNTPVGQYFSKMKELNILGYHSAMVLWTDYTKYDTKEDKLQYIRECVKQAVYKNNIIEQTQRL